MWVPLPFSHFSEHLHIWASPGQEITLWSGDRDSRASGFKTPSGKMMFSPLFLPPLTRVCTISMVNSWSKHQSRPNFLEIVFKWLLEVKLIKLWRRRRISLPTLSRLTALRAPTHTGLVCLLNNAGEGGSARTSGNNGWRVSRGKQLRIRFLFSTPTKGYADKAPTCPPPFLARHGAV